MRILFLTPTFLPVVRGADLTLFEVYRAARAATPGRAGHRAAPALLRDHPSPEYDGLVPFPVERYADRVSFHGAQRGGQVPVGGGAFLPPPPVHSSKRRNRAVVKLFCRSSFLAPSSP
jgi:hypothetical protein